MPQFRYHALNAANQPVAGEILADSVAQAIAQLEAADLSVLSIGFATDERPIAPPLPNNFETTNHAGPSFLTATERASLEARLVQIVERGRALAPAMAAYAAEMPRSSASRSRILDLIRIVQSGEIAQAVADLQNRPDYWIPLIGGTTLPLDDYQYLQAILHEFPQVTPFTAPGRVWLVYPFVLVCSATAVFLFIGFLVVPVFRDLFAGFGLRLPELTQFVLSFYASITNPAFIAIAAFIGIAVIIVNRIAASPGSSSSGAHWPEPRARALAQLSKYLANLLDADFTAATSMRLASFAIQRPQIKRAAFRAADALASSATSANSADRRTITASVLFALQAEIPGRARSALLREISRSHQQRAGAGLSWRRGAFEPLSILVVGLLVAMTVIGLYLPLLSLLQALT